MLFRRMSEVKIAALCWQESYWPPDLTTTHSSICTRVSCPPLAWRSHSITWGGGSCPTAFSHGELISCSDKDLQRNYDTFTQMNKIDVDDMLVHPHPMILQRIHKTQGRTGSSIASTQRWVTLKQSWSDLKRFWCLIFHARLITAILNNRSDWKFIPGYGLDWRPLCGRKCCRSTFG